MIPFAPIHRRFAEAVSDYAITNPFDVERHRECERLVRDTIASGALEGLEVHAPPVVRGRPEIVPIVGAAESFARAVRRAILDEAGRISPGDYELYAHVANTVLYYRFRDRLQRALEEGMRATEDRPPRVDFYDDFEADWMEFFGSDSASPYPNPLRTRPHAFACFFQVRRAYNLIDGSIVGGSRAAGRLRANVWNSVFTFDFHRHGRMLYDRMHDISTLVTGPSGTGKELVARAIGLSRYIPFDPREQRFVEDFGGAFHPLNIAAMAETLVESELFGHVKGAFTGATTVREGWFELCGQAHTVFLDEIGELTPAIQVKLLRVLQNRTFQRLGETRERRFEGKLVAATNRDLGEELSAGRFREDIYYRLCSDVVRTPSLREQIADDSAELEELVRFVARRVVPEESEAELVAVDVIRWIDRSLGRDYDWPGNFRELEQCVKNVLVRNEYVPLRRERMGESRTLADDFERGEMTIEELLQRYCRLVHQQTGGYAQAARVLGIDQRTTKRYVSRGTSHPDR